MDISTPDRLLNAPAKGISIEVEPLLLSEQDAARLLSESGELRRRRRYEDEARILEGCEPRGPRWIKDGSRVKYAVTELRRYARARMREAARNAANKRIDK